MAFQPSMAYCSSSAFLLFGPEGFNRSSSHEALTGPFGGSDAFRTLLAYLDGGGSVAVEFAAAARFDLQKEQVQGLAALRVHEGNKAAMLSLTA